MALSPRDGPLSTPTVPVIAEMMSERSENRRASMTDVFTDTASRRASTAGMDTPCKILAIWPIGLKIQKVSLA